MCMCAWNFAHAHANFVHAHVRNHGICARAQIDSARGRCSNTSIFFLRDWDHWSYNVHCCMFASFLYNTNLFCDYYCGSCSSLVSLHDLLILPCESSLSPCKCFPGNFHVVTFPSSYWQISFFSLYVFLSRVECTCFVGIFC